MGIQEEKVKKRMKQIKPMRRLMDKTRRDLQQITIKNHLINMAKSHFIIKAVEIRDRIKIRADFNQESLKSLEEIRSEKLGLKFRNRWPDDIPL